MRVGIITLAAAAISVLAVGVVSVPRTSKDRFLSSGLASSAAEAPADRAPDAIWKLYPKGQMPGTLKEEIGGEQRVLADTARDPVGMRCAPGGHPAGDYIYNVREPEVLAYLVSRSDRHWKDTAVVIAPGGGNIHLAINVTGTDMARWFNSIGVSAFVVKYRVPTSAWSQGDAVKTQDMQRAMSLVRHKASELGLNPKRIGAVGASAGGGPCVAIATAETRSYQHIDVVDSTSFRPSFLVLLYPSIPVEAYRPAAAGRAPPTYIAMAQDDPCVPPAMVKTWNLGLQAKRVHSEMHVFRAGGHGWGTCRLYPQLQSYEACGWVKSAEKFLKAKGMLSD